MEQGAITASSTVRAFAERATKRQFRSSIRDTRESGHDGSRRIRREVLSQRFWWEITIAGSNAIVVTQKY